MNGKRKVGGAIVLLFLAFTLISYTTLDKEKLENWDNYLYWVDYPRGARPQWLGGTSESVEFFGKTEYIVRESPPENIILMGHGNVSVTILRPDGKVVKLSAEINGTTSVNSNVELSLQVKKFALEELHLRQEDMAFITPTKVLFMTEGREPLVGEYQLLVQPDDVYVRIIGDSYGLLGTDYRGRDLWVGFVGSTVNTLFLAFLTTLIVLAFGVVLGVVSGYYENRMGDSVSVILEALNSVPYLPLAIGILFVISSTGTHGKLEMSVFELASVLALLLVGKFASAVKGIVMHEKVQEYVESSKALGANDVFIILRHMMKAILPYAVSYSTLLFAQMIAVVSVLGLFQIVPGVNWGSFVAEAFFQSAVYSLWWWPLSPSVAIISVSLGLTLLSSE